ncbi:iron complex outermembrane receptor protein [Altererythrobacter atlanticus]|uniref:Colicin I receptor n=1 Tax=Croceibacterium atlanticum TaxID=1267766 RepID=A0A0F7KQR5_9SPHN|nr:TonB-dependent receptor [Croceibacterium atlanticum]AKH41517.1 Colicin I receptor precursor [Croceibacterium atlanticum]MBB5732979.1 iron complex outermembrane receptor protein [Croceibacterium atlanticum]
MKLRTGHAFFGSASQIAAAAVMLSGAAANAQVAPETQSVAEPLPAERQADARAAEANQPGPGNSPTVGAGNEIVVTAQFREQNLQDTPLAITAVSAAMLEARSQTDLSQVARQAPNVSLAPAGQSFGASMIASIRGVGQGDFNPALEPGVGIYVDDVYYATLTGSVLDLLDLERVEVLRGPQGTLSGRNSIGGAIKLFSKRPTGDNTGYVAATYGIRNRLDIRASGDFGLAEGVDMRLSGVSKRQKGYVERRDFGCDYPAGDDPAINPADGIPRVVPFESDCVIAREGEIDYSAVRGQLRLRPTSSLDINIIADYTYDDRASTPSVIIPFRDENGDLVSPNVPYTASINPFEAPIALDSRFLCGRYCNYSTFNHVATDSYAPFQTSGRFMFEGWGVSGQLEWDLAPSLQLVSITAYRTYSSEFSNDSDLTPLAQHLGLSILDFDFFSQELRLNGAFGANDEVEYTLGGYYSDQKSIYTARQEFRDSLGAFYQRDPVPAESKAVFAHVAWSPLADLTVSAGLRYTDESKSYTFVRLTPEGDPHPILRALNGVTGDYQTDRFDYRLNAQYRWSDNVMTYAQLSTGYKGGGINPRPFFAPQARSFGPEELTSYEAGLKTDWFNRALRINIAAFLSKYDGIQLTLSDCPGLGVPARPCAQPANAGDADVQGFEVEASLAPFEGTLIDMAVSHLDFDYTYINPSAGGPTSPTGPQYGDTRPYTPSWKWSIGAQHRFELGDAGSLTPRVDASYQSDIFTGANNVYNTIDAYTLVNARLTWRNRDEDLEVSAELTNLFDKYYFLTRGAATTLGSTFITGQPGRPREWAVSVKKKF